MVPPNLHVWKSNMNNGDIMRPERAGASSSVSVISYSVHTVDNFGAEPVIKNKSLIVKRTRKSGAAI